MPLSPVQPHTRFQRAKPKSSSSASAVTVIFGTLLLACAAGLVYHISTLGTSNAELKSIAEAAEARSRTDQAKRLLEQVGVPRKASIPVEPQQPIQARTAAFPPAKEEKVPEAPANATLPAPGFLVTLWNKVTQRPQPAEKQVSAVPSPAEPDQAKAKSVAGTSQTMADTDMGKRLLEHIGNKQQTAAKTPVPAATASSTTSAVVPSPAPQPPTEQTPTSKTSITAAAPAAATPSASGGFDALLRNWGLRRLPHVSSETAKGEISEPPRQSPELLPPLTRAKFANFEWPKSTLPSVVAPPELPAVIMRPFDPSTWARFLLSEHDRTPVREVVSVDPPVVSPAALPPVAVTMPQTPPIRAVAIPRPTSDNRVRQSSQAECTAVIERAQLGELTPQDRVFLQDRCR